MQLSRVATVVVSMFLVASCAGDYKKATEAFHSAAADTASVIKVGNDSVSKLALEVRREVAVARPATISIRAGHCTTNGTTGCQLDFERIRGTKKPLIEEQAPLENTLRLARAVEAYSASLKAITDSNTASEVKTAVADANGALESLLSTATNGAKKGGGRLLCTTSGGSIRLAAGPIREGGATGGATSRNRCSGRGRPGHWAHGRGYGRVRRRHR